MKDQHDIETREILQKKESLLKNKYGLSQRLHVEINSKKTTVSIDTYLYGLLAVKLETTPHTRTANKAIKEWIYTMIERREWEAGNNFFLKGNASKFISREIIFFLVGDKLKDKYLSHAFDDL